MRLGNRDRQPAELADLFPDVRIIAEIVVDQPAHLVDRALVATEIGRHVHQFDLLFGRPDCT